MHTAAPHSAYPLPPPSKRRRRTATSVLAGYFDPRPIRDFFTDMANSSDPLNPYNSVLGHGPGILFDVRSQREKLSGVSREQRRLHRNSRRKDRDLEARRAKDEQIPKRASRVADRFSEIARVNSPYTAGASQASVGTPLPCFSNSSGTSALAPPFEQRSTMQSPRAVREFLAPSQDRPSAPLPSNSRPSQWSPAPPQPPVPMAPDLAVNFVPPPPAALPNSPPTPSRSVSSYTSYGSSKRPRTPDDEDEILAGPSHVQFDPRNAFQMCDTAGNMYSPDAVSLTGVAPPKDKLSDVPTHNVSAWFALPRERELPHSTPSEPYWAAAQPQSSYFDGHPVSPASTAHRRRALSVAALLSPSVPPPSVSVSPPTIPAPPPAPEIQMQQRTPPSQHAEFPSAIPNASPETEMVDMTCTQPHEPAAFLGPEASVAAASTVNSSCLSPLAALSPAGAGDLAYDSRAPDVDPVDEPYEPAGLRLVESLPVAADSQPCKELGHTEAKMPERDESAQPEGSTRAKGRASKAMRIIESDDELTDLEMLAAPPPPPLPRLPQRRRTAVRKGWKGWVEVEVEDNDLLPRKRLDIDTLPLLSGERRTRSGRQFDS